MPLSIDFPCRRFACALAAGAILALPALGAGPGQPADAPASAAKPAPATAGSAAATPNDSADAAPRGADGLLVVPPLARVWDPDAYLGAADKAAIDARLADFEAQHGSQIAVLLVGSTQPEPIEDFAHRVGDSWKIGRRGIGDGVLVVVAVRDRAARIDVSLSLQGAIPDLAARRLVQRMGPHFASGDYAGGLNTGLDGLFVLITGEGLAPGPGTRAHTAAGGEDAIRSLLPYLVGFAIAGAVLRRILGMVGALVAAAGAVGIVGFVFSSLVLGIVAGAVVLFLALFGGPLMAMQVLGGRGGGGFSSGGGGFSSGGGGNFNGGGASGNW
jgi:uncharacterized protein